MKKMIALLLAVCVMCSMLIVTVSAAEPKSMMRVETVTTKAANVRKYPNTNALIYGNLMRGETWNTTSPTTNSWFYGTADLKLHFMRSMAIWLLMWQAAILNNTNLGVIRKR